MNRHNRNARMGNMMLALALASCSIAPAGTASAENPSGTGAESRQPVKYLVKEKSLIGNDVHEAGATVSYAGLPSDNLEPLCDEGRARAAEYVASNAARIKQMTDTHGGQSAVGDPTKFLEAFTTALAEERAEHAAQMARMVEMNQNAAMQLAEAAKNMAILAAAITTAPAASVAPAAAQIDTASASTESSGDTSKETAIDTAPAKRTRS